MNQVTFSENEFKDVLNKNIEDKKIVVLKFTAEWCNPCKKIKSHCEEFCKNMSTNILFYEIDVDESIELYIKFKKIRMVNSIPAILVYYPEARDYWYIPNDSCNTSDLNVLNGLFKRLNDKVK